MVIIAITHPCFRQYKFSTFHTEFLNNKEFNYNEDEKQFSVEINSPMDNIKDTFYDTHWKLSTTLNVLIEGGFEICKIEELRDVEINKHYHNPYIPPYLIIICR